VVKKIGTQRFIAFAERLIVAACVIESVSSVVPSAAEFQQSLYPPSNTASNYLMRLTGLQLYRGERVGT